VALLPLVALLLVVQFRSGHPWTWAPLTVAVLAGIAAPPLLAAGREGRAFGALAIALVASVATLFGALYPDVLPSTLDGSYSLTVAGAASAPYTLTVMSWVAVFGAPAVLIYQGWTYWVFRRRIGTEHIPAAHASGGH
jgi:cytochrome d ubiquinol oxidase subunit II